MPGWRVGKPARLRAEKLMLALAAGAAPALAGSAPASFTVGLAERREGDSLEDLIRRAEIAMTQVRGRPGGREPRANQSSKKR